MKPPIQMRTLEQVCAFLGCTEEQAKAQFRKNAAQLRQMEAIARAKGRKVSNFTADELAGMAAIAESRAGIANAKGGAI